jgi:hypothetical protein
MAATAPAVSRYTAYSAVQSYNFNDRFSEAQTLLASGKKAEARDRFEEILSRLKSIVVPADSIFPAACKLGLASAHDDDLSARASFAVMAKDDLYRIFDNRLVFDRLTPKDRTASYEALIRCFRQLQSLMTSLHQEIEEKIRECSRHVPLSQMAAAVPPIPGPSRSTGPDSPPIHPTRVSRGNPDGNLCRLFAAVILIALAVTAAVALYRRNVVKIN